MNKQKRLFIASLTGLLLAGFIATSLISYYVAKDSVGHHLEKQLLPLISDDIYSEIRRDLLERIEAALTINILVSIGITTLVLLLAHSTLGGYQRRLAQMESRDKLTGAASRQAFDSLFGHATKISDRRGSALSLVAIDIDNFKEINESYGHQQGDDMIRTVANLIDQKVRDSDVLCRWGGEEFLLLLEDCDLKRATALAEKVRRAVKNYKFVFDNKETQLTISLGVAEHRTGECQDELIERCDQALYRSKHEGRDRVSQS